MEDVRQLKMPIPSFDVRRLNRAIEAYTTMGRDKALKYMQSLKLADFNPIEVSWDAQFVSSHNSGHQKKNTRWKPSLPSLVD